jgi:hypothetical protein
MYARRNTVRGPHEDLLALARLEAGAAAACAQRARTAAQPWMRAKMRELWTHHLRHVEALTRVLAHRGDPRPTLTTERLPALGTPSPLGTRGDLLEAVRDERDVAAAYEALVDREWDRATRQVIASNLADQEAHIEWLEEQIELDGRGPTTPRERVTTALSA